MNTHSVHTPSYLPLFSISFNWPPSFVTIYNPLLYLFISLARCRIILFFFYFIHIAKHSVPSIHVEMIKKHNMVERTCPPYYFTIGTSKIITVIVYFIGYLSWHDKLNLDNLTTLGLITGFGDSVGLVPTEFSEYHGDWTLDMLVVVILVLGNSFLLFWFSSASFLK